MAMWYTEPLLIQIITVSIRTAPLPLVLVGPFNGLAAALPWHRFEDEFIACPFWCVTTTASCSLLQFREAYWVVSIGDVTYEKESFAFSF